MTKVEEILEHHGVKGMKWGVSRAGSIAKASRVNANNRQISRWEKAATRKFFPAPKTAAVRIKDLKESNDRIQTGRLKVKDVLDIHSKIKIKDIRKAINDTDL